MTEAGRRDDEALVTIAMFDTEFEASVARGALEAIGIDAHATSSCARSADHSLLIARAPTTLPSSTAELLGRLDASIRSRRRSRQG